MNCDSATAREIREKLDSLRPLRRRVDKIDPETTCVATASSMLAEAVEHYRAVSGNSRLPVFVLVDRETVPSRPSASGSGMLEPVVLPVGSLRDAGFGSVCLYVPKSRSRYNPKGYFYIALKLHACGIDSFVMDEDAPELSRWWGLQEGYFGKNMRDICAVYKMLEDDASKDTFLRVIKGAALDDHGYAPVVGYAQYDHPLVNAAPGDVVCEGGLEDGFTTYIFAERVGPRGKVVGFEPSPKNAALCRSQLHSANILIEELGLWSHDTEMYITDAGSSSRIVGQASSGDLCRLTSLDAYLSAKGFPCDLIKMDIEGAEAEALEGAMDTIRRYRPKLQISLYHKPDHYLHIPLMLLREKLGYRFYLGHHMPWLGETVLYATTEPEEQALARTRAVSAKQRESRENALKNVEAQAARLAGKEVLFFGAGEAYEYYQGLFSACVPQAMVMDQRFFPEAKSITAVPLMTPEEAFARYPSLPVVIFTRSGHEWLFRGKLAKAFPQKPAEDIVFCVLY